MTEYKLPEGMCFVRDLKVGDKFGRWPARMCHTVAVEDSDDDYIETTGGETVHWHTDCVVYVIRKPERIEVDKAEYGRTLRKLHDIREAIGVNLCRSAHQLEREILSILDRT